jgi:membrane fusion protein, multidrug efflux system
MKRVMIASLAMLLLVACGKQTPEQNQKKIDGINARIQKLEARKKVLQEASDTAVVEKVFPVRVQALKIDTIEKIVSFSTNLAPYEEVHLAPASPGRVEKVFVKIGDRVAKGTLLAKMDETQLNQAKLQLAQLETEYTRMKTLRETNSISVQQYDQIKTQVEVTRSSVKYMEENTKIVAPFNGIITGKYFENGELYSGAPNTQAGKAAIVTIQQIDALKAIVSISEKYFTELNTGTPMTIFSDIFPGEQFAGKVERIYPTIDPLTRSFKIEIKVVNNGLKLRPGMFSKVDIKLGEATTIMVPEIAIIQQEGTNNRHIFINNNGIARMVKIELGERINDQLEAISEELKEGDELIVAGQAVIMDGSKIQVTL